MNHAIKMTALAVFAASFAAPALANKSNELDLYVDSETQSLYSQPGPGRVKLGTFQPVDVKAQAQAKSAGVASTKGGFEIKSEDGNFTAKLGGRIHLDANVYADDDDLKPANGTDQFFFRRARLTIEGKAYDFTYKFENDFAGQNATSGSGFREMWIGKKVLGGHNLRIGQAKPYRGMEELTSSNEITFMERPLATATGIYGKQFVTGAFLDGSGNGYGYGVSAYSPTTAADSEAGGFGFNARGFVVPVSSDSTVVHLGLSVSVDDFDMADTSVGPRIVGREKGLRSAISDIDANEQTTVGLEAAAMFGPLLVQGEYARANFENSNTSVENDVNTGYIQAAYMLTSHQRRYDAKKGVFKSPKVDGKTGALELKARYDMIENKDVNGAEADYFAVGFNYYATPNTRFMVEYVDGSDDVTGNEAAAITARAQFNF